MDVHFGGFKLGLGAESCTLYQHCLWGYRNDAIEGPISDDSRRGDECLPSLECVSKVRRRSNTAETGQYGLSRERESVLREFEGIMRCRLWGRMGFNDERGDNAE